MRSMIGTIVQQSVTYHPYPVTQVIFSRHPFFIDISLSQQHHKGVVFLGLIGGGQKRITYVEYHKTKKVHRVEPYCLLVNTQLCTILTLLEEQLRNLYGNLVTSRKNNDYPW